MPRHPPSLRRVPSESVPLLHRSNSDAARSRSRRSPPWLGADSIHRSDSFARLRRRIATPPQVQGFGDPVSQPDCRRCRSGTVPSSWGTLHACAPGRCPGGSDHQAIAMVRVLPAPCFTATAPTLCPHFGAVYRGPRCSLSTLHPGEGHSPIRKTRFRLLARLCRSRVSHPRRVPSRGFGHVLGQVIAVLLSQAFLAHKACAPASHAVGRTVVVARGPRKPRDPPSR